MKDTEKLITAARRYCIENFSFWFDRYVKENYLKEKHGNNDFYSKKEYNLFPRYNVLTAIRQGVETLVGGNFSSFESCKDMLKEIGRNSNSILTINSNEELYLLGESGKNCKVSRQQQNSIEKNAMLEERKKFIEFIETRTPENVFNVEPLPYRRKLADKEMLEVRQKLLDQWKFDGDYWDPLEDKCPKETVWLMGDNLSLNDQAKIIDLLEKISTDRIYVITEDRIDYEMDFDSFYFGECDDGVNLCETMVTNKTFEWVIYWSLESTITFGGDCLINFIKKLFAEKVQIKQP